MKLRCRSRGPEVGGAAVVHENEAFAPGADRGSRARAAIVAEVLDVGRSVVVGWWWRDRRRRQPQSLVFVDGRPAAASATAADRCSERRPDAPYSGGVGERRRRVPPRAARLRRARPQCVAETARGCHVRTHSVRVRTAPWWPRYMSRESYLNSFLETRTECRRPPGCSCGAVWGGRAGRSGARAGVPMNTRVGTDFQTVAGR